MFLARLAGSPERASLTGPAPARPGVVHPGSDGQPFPLLTELIAALSQETPPEVLVFGDSVMERVSQHDTDTRTLGRMICEALPARRCHVASRTALNPTLMRALMRVVRRLHPPRLVVLPVNMRAFSPQWDLNPAWEMHQELGILEAWLSNPDLPIAPLWDLRKSDDLHASYERTAVRYPLSELDTIGAFRRVIATDPENGTEKQRRKREIFVYHYTHPLTENHRKLVDLVGATELCRLVGAVPLLYVTPINVETGRELVGEQFTEALAANIECVRSALAPVASLRDYSAELPSSDFFAEDLATEHLNQHGRTVLARRIAREIDAMLVPKA